MFSTGLVSADDSFTDLQAIIDGSATGGEVILNNNYKYNSSTDSGLNNGITISHNNFVLDGGNNTIDGDGKVALLYITGNNVTIKNLNFINANSQSSGAIFTYFNNYGDYSFNIYNCSFINNTAESYGGGAISAHISNYGGGIYSFNIYNTSFINNTAESGSGGAINFNSPNGWNPGIGSSFNIYNSLFINNTAESGSGGAIYMWGNRISSSFNVYNSSFINNTASYSGAIGTSFHGPGNFSLNVYNSSFLNNTATSNGGAIYSSFNAYSGMYSFAVYDSLFVNNTATSNGGAIYVDISDMGGISNIAVHNSLFINNTATSNGGAIFWRHYDYGDENFNVNITGSFFKNNNALFGSSIYFTDLKYSGYEVINNISINYNAILDSNPIYNNDTENDINTTNTVNLNYNWWGSNNVSLDNKVKGFLDNVTLNNYYIMNLTGSNLNFTVGDEYPFDYIFMLNDTSIANNVSLLPKFMVDLTINGNNITTIDGRYNTSLNATIPSINNTIVASSYDADIVNLTFNAENNRNINLNADNITMYFRNGTQYLVTVTDAIGNLLKNVTIYITVNGITYERTTNENGTAYLDINLNPGNYTVNALFNGSDEFDPKNITTNLEVLTILLADDVVKFFRNGTHYDITVLNGTGGRLANATVTINIHGVFYNVTTNASGIARLEINLNPGEYIATVTYNGLSISNNVTVNSTLRAQDLNKTFGVNATWDIEVLDAIGNPLPGEVVSINIHGVFYNVTSGSDGIARLPINLNPGSYIATATWNTYSTSSTIIVKA